MRLKKIIFTLQTHLSKAIQKNMLIAWNFTKNKMYYKCFDNNLQNGSEQKFFL